MVNPRKLDQNDDRSTLVLHFGQMLPLHGLGTILAAAALAKDHDILWTLIGDGQDANLVHQALLTGDLPKVKWIGWLPRTELVRRIQESDICLGIFGESEKAARVIPNKVQEAIALGKPIVTLDSPGIRELMSPDMPGIKLIPAGDPRALYEGVLELREQLPSLEQSELHVDLIERISPRSIGAELLNALRPLTD